jgi:hypothetical protein
MTTTVSSRPLFRIHITLHPIQELGSTPLGRRRIFPVSGGSFEGERLRGRILPHGGGDWLLLRPDGSSQQDVRMILETDDGALVGMTYRGVRHSSEAVSAQLTRGEFPDPSSYYLRTAPFFETSDPRYGWLNHLVAVGVGERVPDGVVYEVFEIL